MQQHGLAEHDHGEALARAGCVPDHTALPRAISVECLQLVQQRADTEHLLVTRGDLAVFPVIERRIAHEVDEPVRAQQTDQHTVHVVHKGGTMRETRHLLARLQTQIAIERVGASEGRCALDRRQSLLADLFLAPTGVELSRRAHSAVSAVGAVDGHQKLSMGKQMRDFVRALIANVLADPLAQHCLHALAAIVGALGLDHDQRQAIHKPDDVGTAVTIAACLLDFELFGHAEPVCVRSVPIYQRHRHAVRLAVHELRDRHAE